MLPHISGTGIIYVATQRHSEMVATFLTQLGFAADYYHARRDDDVRQSIEQKLMLNHCKVICSTNALGMGIDKSDVRFIVHYHVPASPIHYYQEMGRAGRDGGAASCILLYDPADAIIQERFINSAKPATHRYETVLSVLKTNFQALREIDIARITGLSATVLRTILADLEDQRLIERSRKDRTYTLLDCQKQLDFSAYDIVREEKLHEFDAIQQYATQENCYMGYLTAYLGDQPGYVCGTCGKCMPTNFPLVQLAQRTRDAVARFLDKEWLPRIEKRSIVGKTVHEMGWSLSYHGNSTTGQLVRASKYEGAGAFDTHLVKSAIDVINTRYPVGMIDAIVSVPSTRSGSLVEDFARQVASELNIVYLPALIKIRATREQKELSNRVQKKDNVKGAFQVQAPDAVTERTLLLIDDIYDSGYTLRETGHTLMKAGAKMIYPFTITRTAQSDDQ
jgi:ATP-dependent DNA helicase RecQ